MNEEEKQAIEYLKLKIKKDNLTIQGMFGDIYEEIQKDNKAIETILNLIDKQQKEIEELKHFKKEVTDIIKYADDTAEPTYWNIRRLLGE